MNKKEVTFNVKYEIVLYTPVFNARWGGGGVQSLFGQCPNAEYMNDYGSSLF